MLDICEGPELGYLIMFVGNWVKNASRSYDCRSRTGAGAGSGWKFAAPATITFWCVINAKCNKQSWIASCLAFINFQTLDLILALGTENGARSRGAGPEPFRILLPNTHGLTHTQTPTYTFFCTHIFHTQFNHTTEYLCVHHGFFSFSYFFF